MTIHFIGIGGIGVSALAKYYLEKGYQISGSDLISSEITESLKRKGAKILIGPHKAKNLPQNVDFIIYSLAISKNNPELRQAYQLQKTNPKVQVLSYPQALGELTKNYYTIAISGSHGKSTTTALLSLILIKAGLDPTVILGTKLRQLGDNELDSNFRLGKSKYLVIEADEWSRSFNFYFPKIVILTNIDKEHLDTYKTYQGVKRGFKNYLKNLLPDGILVANYQDQASRQIGEELEKEKSLKVVFYAKTKFKKHPLLIPGFYNQINAEGAWQAWKIIAQLEKIKLKKAKKITSFVFGNYQGAWRRLEQLSSVFYPSATIYSDYAHHPTEIKVTLSALREKYPFKKIVCIFQPHQQRRFNSLFKDFIFAFKEVDKLVLLPVYRAVGRDTKTGPSSFDLVQKIKRYQKEVYYFPNFSSIFKKIKNDFQDSSVIIFMGAGNLDSQIRKFLF